ncbi:MAG: hypothetical protein K6E68_02915 [Lachnospiraceae bacterium]|nr:hypothetical protein [Lachnospiraceae bacterium]
MLDRYLKILSESLDKKADILKNIERLSKEQSELIDNDATYEDIDANMDAKDALISEIIKLDEGFEAMYDNIKSSLNESPREHKDQIADIQEKIRTVMGLGASIEAIEARNKDRMEKRFAEEKRTLQDARKVSTAAYDYYKVTNKLNVVTPQFMDKKK